MFRVFRNIRSEIQMKWKLLNFKNKNKKNGVESMLIKY